MALKCGQKSNLSFSLVVLIGISNLYDLPTIMLLTRKVDYADH